MLASFLSLSRFSRSTGVGLFAGCVLTGLLLTGCSSTGSTSYPIPTGDVGTQPVDSLTLSEGDVILVSFPGAPDLNITQTIRRDGLVDLPLIDEVVAVGKTPKELEMLLVQLYEPQLVSSEVKVTVVSSSIPIFVSGSVAAPGKILVSRRITALEAIMEAGGPIMGRSDLKNVTVIREDNGVRKNYRLNIKDILDGKPAESFILQASDIVYVPELKF